MTLKLRFPLVVLAALTACRDAAGPGNEARGASTPGVQAKVVRDATADTPPRILQQSPTAPPLETYRVSFWARHDKASWVAVNYQPVAGQSVGQPFLRFFIPKFGLMWAPDGSRLRGHDSLFITITIDPVDLSAEFQPSGTGFSRVLAPHLVMWYANANPDLNADGVVDSTDEELRQRLSLWGTTKPRHWFKLASQNDTTQQFVASELYHFSEYAISW